jgi:hypothetical protein
LKGAVLTSLRPLDVFLVLLSHSTDATEEMIAAVLCERAFDYVKLPKFASINRSSDSETAAGETTGRDGRGFIY